MIDLLRSPSSPSRRSSRSQGRFFPESLGRTLADRLNAERVEGLGMLDRERGCALLGRASVILLIPFATLKHADSQPNRPIEFMSAGLPVVASDFPLWRRIVDDAGCGLLVDPLDPAALARAIDRLLSDLEEAEQMSRRGRKAVERQYNWQLEEVRLLELYNAL